MDATIFMQKNRELSIVAVIRFRAGTG